MREKRIDNLREVLERRNLDVALVLYHLNVYYFNATAQLGALIVPREGDPVFYVIRDYERAKEESEFKCVKVKSFGEILSKVKGQRVGVDLSLVNGKILSRLSGMSFEDITDEILRLRMVKDEEEIKLVEKAVNMCCEVLEKVPEILKDGMREFELAAKLECELKMLGHDGYLEGRNFDYLPNVVVASSGSAKPSKLSAVTAGAGMSAACPIGSGKKRMRRGDVVWIDIGGRVEGYSSDVTRCFTIGKADESVYETYERLKELYENCLKMMREGIEVGEFFRKAFELAKELEIFDGFMGRVEKMKFVGHGIGLNIDEYPVLGDFKEKLKRNVVVAFEPKVILEDFTGLGIESDVLIGEKAEVLDKITFELVEC
ncbi:peptidase M24 [Ferroglobus placidus DSM 10642]|uniref:Peptidase M24 n=1 Tax=Ferroglobus placidus (strain DSM 10642 / AEDII12DO) TaxID=589924 RepID=D3S3D8_FERPA|nr:Xaa-Pro peptidase family protein [Ferroglobus placidus]ADC64771.1 peptidase M24 [Ferroglobus placidus DSM 10642]